MYRDKEDLVQQALLIAWSRGLLAKTFSAIQSRNLLHDAYRSIHRTHGGISRRVLEVLTIFDDDEGLQIATPPNQWSDMEAKQDTSLSPEEAAFEKSIGPPARGKTTALDFKRESETRWATNSLPLTHTDFVYMLARMEA
jgi:DNA-directed RNA polymerase specialized sigma24 family protein